MAEAIDPNQGESNDQEEQKIAEETEGVLKFVMLKELSSQFKEEASQGSFDELKSETTPDGSSKFVVNQELGRALGEAGDQVYKKYQNEYSEMVKMLKLTPSTAYDAFAAVARKLFLNGISWGRIIALLYFGYEIAVTVIKNHIGETGSFFRQIVSFVVKFVLQERIARWIADNGGWEALIDFRNHNENLWCMRLLFLAVITAGIMGVARYLK